MNKDTAAGATLLTLVLLLEPLLRLLCDCPMFAGGASTCRMPPSNNVTWKMCARDEVFVATTTLTVPARGSKDFMKPGYVVR